MTKASTVERHTLSIVVDNEAGAASAVAHLVGLAACRGSHRVVARVTFTAASAGVTGHYEQRGQLAFLVGVHERDQHRTRLYQAC